ncbi:VWA domain-containing protein [Antarcticibacterium flavum]|uniref:VWA domain-containing protein n=1 Tax=Antarcticibacterium flavum TaxID=2058175 RepID=A0A5B7X484_9FLAO|nr:MULTISPECIES: VWA domain-containing protein [Antarcticibacterium]MCM4159130.1 aerotolerance regulator BatA [Antarcticibacterium sp. W02-3]QCY69531.1 VWA domain-containing protein [Antarcticibacterium flavum]
MLENFTFENPGFFWLLALLPLLAAWYFWKKDKQQAELRMSSLKGFKGTKSILPTLRHILIFLRLLALAFFIVAMARPRTTDVTSRTSSTQGIDIVLAIDVSASMLARDLKPNRLEALKEVAAEFIQDRVTDRIGLVVYAGESFTLTPVTSDKVVVLNALKDIEYNNVIEGGTAIGMGLATSVNRLKDSNAKSKVIILLTDGVNNAGFIDPLIASELAVEYEIKTYTIGLGSNGMALSPIGTLPNGQFQYGNVPVEIDEQLMQDIAKTTGGRYFRATNNEKLEEIYEEIDALEKTEIEELKYYNYEERFRPFLLIGGLLLIMELLLRFTIFRSFI